MPLPRSYLHRIFTHAAITGLQTSCLVLLTSRRSAAWSKRLSRLSRWLLRASLYRLTLGYITPASSPLSIGWHPITPCTVLSIGDERGRTARFRVIKVRSHHAAPTPITLAESSTAVRLPAGVLVYKCLHGLAPSHLADELHHAAESKASAFRFAS